MTERRAAGQALDDAREVITEITEHAWRGQVRRGGRQRAAVLGEKLFGRRKRIGAEPLYRATLRVEPHERTTAADQRRAR